MMKKNNLSVLILSKNNEDVLENCLKSTEKLNCDIIIIDSHSTDNTLTIAKSYTKKIYDYKGLNLGKKRKFAINKVRSEWILFLDADERLSNKLIIEINTTISEYSKYNSFFIPFANHYLGKRVRHGGENYKMIRLLKKSDTLIKPSLVHEEIYSKTKKTGVLNGKIFHYSYRSINQLYSKFTDYAFRDAKQKAQNKEKTSLKKIFLYPLHMFWSRFIKDKGYKDGLFRIPLDLGFAYMEFLTYISLPFYKIKK